MIKGVLLPSPPIDAVGVVLGQEEAVEINPPPPPPAAARGRGGR